MGLPKHRRLKKREDFERSRKVGIPYHGKLFLWVLVPSDSSLPRLGLAVTKKLFPRAVDRNRVKRVVREVFRENSQLIPNGYDVVVVAKGPAREADYNSCLRELEGLKVRGRKSRGLR